MMSWKMSFMRAQAVWNAGGNFPLRSAKKEIVDLFDVYCDIQESLADEGLKPSS